ncbi:MAG: ArsC family reductase [Burkholderiaceae bacterium]|nr:ArsC family reductase [Burkholderiaceae bacterium]
MSEKPRPESPTEIAITLYGIPNCDTVKKARTWLSENGIAFRFHDFKKDGLTKTTVEKWLESLSLDLLINRKGTTWRALNDAEKASADHVPSAITLMLASPSVIKRPVLHLAHANGQDGSEFMVGFSADQYKSFFKK